MTTHSGCPPRARAVAAVTIALFVWSGFAAAQAPVGASPDPTANPGNGAAAPTAKTFSQQELDQLLAPIALYPDNLLAQVLMASTYPLEIVRAERWVKANPKLKDKALEEALQQQPWDESVKSLAMVPPVLTMMSEKLDWTQKLGDAVLAQQADVMATAQALRAKASAEGVLKDTKEQKVVTEQSGATTVIRIEQSNPEVVYVPTYDPMVVYGAWPYPAYPPYYYYPPGYVAGGALLGFTAGVIVGSALWGNCIWGGPYGGSVNVNVNRYNNFNRTNISNGNWNHNVDHRGAVPYKDQRVAQQYNRGASPTAQNRDAYRGRDGGQQGNRGGAGSMDRAGAGSMDRGNAGSFDRGSGAGSNRGASPSTRDMSVSSRGSAFDSGGGRAQTMNASNRGASSMGASSRGSSSMGASRGGGGGGARGGGGGRGGGRR